jgi:cholesterol transport system auxiliary component
MTASTLLRTGAGLACALMLSGCLGGLGGKPANLYRFGGPADAAVTAATGTVPVFRSNGSFQRESAGDQILTVDGGKAAYIGKTRWVAPAQSLWNDAVVAAFDADPGPVRLVSRGEPTKADYVLRLDVRNFETLRAGKSAPTVLIRVRAAMTTDGEKALLNEKIFEARVRASDNRVGEIVQAYDQATDKILAEIVAWTNENAKPTR